MKHFLLLLVFSFSFFSCKTLEEKKFGIEKVSTINGVYLANGLDTIQPADYSNFVKLLNRKIIKDTLYEKPIRKYTFEIVVINTKVLKVKLFDEKNKFLIAENYKYKLKSDNFLLLKNKNIKCSFIPYLLGTIDINKVRLKSDFDGNLRAKIYKHRSGGILMIPLGMTTTEKEMIYKKL